MFTGIVEELGEVVAVARGADSAVLTLRGPLVTSDVSAGASIAVNGVCLTVVSMRLDLLGRRDGRDAERSSLGALTGGDVVNLERAMAASSRFGGHIVQGHVDGTGQILARPPVTAGRSCSSLSRRRCPAMSSRRVPSLSMACPDRLGRHRRHLLGLLDPHHLGTDHLGHKGLATREP